jgi:hypothetical protein
VTAGSAIVGGVVPQRRFVLDQPGGNLALDLFVLAQHLNSMLDAAFAGTGATPSQYAVYSRERMRLAVRRLGAHIGSAAERDALRHALGRLDDAVMAAHHAVAAERAG